MKTMYVMLKYFGLAFLFVVAAFLLYFILKTLYSKLKLKKSFAETLIKTTYVKILDFIKWVLIDTFRGKDRLRLYGIWAFTGYYGQGKTMGCILYAKKLQKDYPHRNIQIYSNIDIVGQAGKITNWREMLDLPKNSIMIYDESQSDWSSTIGVSAFPEDFLRRITQVRKRQLAFFMTSPVFSRMNINLRESVNFVIESSNVMDMDRWFNYSFYRTEEYEKAVANDENKKKYRLFNVSFIASDDTYKMYNTSEEVSSIKDLGESKIAKKDVPNLKGILDGFRNEIHKEMDEKIRSSIQNIKK